MHPQLNLWLQLFARWAHVVAGILWVGHLYYFNFVSAQVMPRLDADTRRVVMPELVPRALFWFRWGAVWTWITGVLIGGLIYYHGRAIFVDEHRSANGWLWLAIVVGSLFLGYGIYNAITDRIANVTLSSTINLALLAGYYVFLERVGHFTPRALYIHTGLMIGTTMVANVWEVIWPAHREIIPAIARGEVPDQRLVARASLRSRQNAFLSIPLLFTMVSNHFPNAYGSAWAMQILALMFVLGFVVVGLLYGKAARV